MISPLFRSVSALTASEQLSYLDYDTGLPISFRVSAIDAVHTARADLRNADYPGDHSFIDSRGVRYHVRTARATVLADIAAISAAAETTMPYVLVVDSKASGTAGGTFTAGAWRTRDLNTELIDTDSLASVAANQVTLAAGLWDCHIVAPARRVDSHRLRLRNVTDGTTLLVGNILVAEATAPGPTSPAILFGQFALAAQKTLEVQHECETTHATNGFGATDSGLDTGIATFFTRAGFRRISV